MADYSSTARSLALPVSPPRSPELQNQSLRPAWTRRPSVLSRTRSNSQNVGYLQQVTHFGDRTKRRIQALWRKLTPLQKGIAIATMIITNVAMILFLIYHESIFHWMEPRAEAWKARTGGWILLWVLTFTTAFPPMIGYSTCVTIAGFIYGFPNGWYIIGTANVIGSTASFLLFRNLFSNVAHRLVSADSRFAALSLVLKHDGLKLLIMIRLCPLPYSLSNAAIATFKTVDPLHFAIATAVAAPKLLIHVFIGSKLREIAKSGDKMDAKTKAINYASIIFGVLLGIGTGYWVYSKTMARSKALEAEERAKLESQRLTTRSAGLSHPDEFDELDEAYDEGDLNDDIDFLDPEAGNTRYRDDTIGDEENAGYDDDGNESIGLDRAKTLR